MATWQKAPEKKQVPKIKIITAANNQKV